MAFDNLIIGLVFNFLWLFSTDLANHLLNNKNESKGRPWINRRVRFSRTTAERSSAYEDFLPSLTQCPNAAAVVTSRNLSDSHWRVRRSDAALFCTNAILVTPSGATKCRQFLER